MGKSFITVLTSFVLIMFSEVWRSDCAVRLRFRSTGFLYSVHRPEFYIQENTTLRKLDLFPFSGEGRATPTVLGPWTDQVIETLCFLVFRIPEMEKSQKPSNSECYIPQILHGSDCLPPTCHSGLILHTMLRTILQTTLHTILHNLLRTILHAVLHTTLHYTLYYTLHPTVHDPTSLKTFDDELDW
jgi:hypothetical protein